MTVAQKILNWFHFYGRKNLPWKKKTAYATWLSEIMLQQTQVKTVIPFFLKFLKKYPTVKKLASASIDEILYLWSGLGYYSRAKNIHKTAKIICKNHNGIFPDNFKTILSFPGIGKSTAGAILSMSFNYHFPILDSNVKRIIIRFYGINHIRKKTESLLWNKIQKILPIHQSGKFNQAIMDLGHLICRPKNPICSNCPIYSQCETIKKNLKFSNVIKTKKILQIKKVWCLIINYKKYVFLKRKKSNNYWDNLFIFPTFKNKTTLSHWIKKKNFRIYKIKSLNFITCQVTKYKIFVHLIIIKILKIFSIEKTKQTIWLNTKNHQRIGIPSFVKTILKNNQGLFY